MHTLSLAASPRSLPRPHSHTCTRVPHAQTDRQTRGEKYGRGEREGCEGRRGAEKEGGGGPGELLVLVVALQQVEGLDGAGQQLQPLVRP